MLSQNTTHLIQRSCYQRGCPCQDPAGNRTTRRPPDHRQETQTEVVWTCLPFIRSGQNHLARHGEMGNETRQTEEEVGGQHNQGMVSCTVWCAVTNIATYGARLKALTSSLPHSRGAEGGGGLGQQSKPVVCGRRVRAKRVHHPTLKTSRDRSMTAASANTSCGQGEVAPLQGGQYVHGVRKRLQSVFI